MEEKRKTEETKNAKVTVFEILLIVDLLSAMSKNPDYFRDAGCVLFPRHRFATSKRKFNYARSALLIGCCGDLI